MMYRALLLAFFCPVVATAQNAPAFEAASVKPTLAGTQPSFRTDLAGLTARSLSLRFAIPYAFDIKVFQISGAPDWLNSEKYDIIARAPAGTSKDQIPLMLRQLLVERFKLTFHREKRKLAVYAVVVGKDGPKVHVEKREKQDGDGRIAARNGLSHGRGVSSSQLGEVLSLFLDRPVLDQTGIDGLFNFNLQWKSDETERQFGPPPTAEQPTQGSDGPSLFSAIQEQLGLKLVGKRAPIDMFIIDYLERVPTEN